MKNRTYWLKLIEDNWQNRSVIWLYGVRRSGKTSLSQSIPDIKYFDCELPSTRIAIEQDPESFLRGLGNSKITLDEIHRLSNPSEVLKIAADHFPKLKIIATGSSTLTASAKFKDTLTGRKTEVWLTPANTTDMEDFEILQYQTRMLRGGLPQPLLNEVPNSFFQEWLDSFWARDIFQLFKVEKQFSFCRFVELIMSRSGSMFEASKYAAPCEASRVTIANYLNILEATAAAHIIRPFSNHKPTEIISAPKVYGFDTGFVCHINAWRELHSTETGLLWEHVVLNELHSKLQTHKINYWRDKAGHEIDFVLERGKTKQITIECKTSARNFDAKSIKSFRSSYPQGANFVVAQDVAFPFEKQFSGISIKFVSLDQLADELSLC